MAERRIVNGWIYERGADGQIVPVGPAQQTPAMPSDPTFPYRGQQAALGVQTQQANLQNDAVRLQMERERLALAREQAAAAAADANTKRGTTDARGGVDSTESERTAAFLATRVAGGIQDLSRIGNIGAPSLKDALVGGTLVGNYTTDADRQRAINAQRDILDAALTLGTGAAYTQEQIDAYRASYFAQPGDAPETIRDKSQRLQRLLEASRLKAGASAGMIDDALAKSVAPAPNPSVTEEDGLSDPNFAITDEGVSPTAPADTPSGGGDYRSSFAGQGMSGINEGIASTLGAPIDLLTMGMNLVPKGINAVTNSKLPSIENPIGGSQSIKDAMSGWGIYGQTKEPSKQFVRRAGQSIGSALVPIGAAPGSMAKAGQALAMSAGGGVGAATAQQIFPNNPVAEFTGEVLGSGLSAGGLIGSGRRAAIKKAIEQVPSRDQLRDQASNLYNVAESRGIVAGPNVTGNLAGRFQKIADDEKMRWPNGKVDPNYTRAGASLDMMEAHNGQSIDPRQIQVMRENLMDAVRGTQGKENRLSRQMLEAFDDETVPLAPELADARRVASRYLQSDEINRARELAEPRAAQFSNSGMENALRTEFRKLDRGIIDGSKTFNPAASQAIRNVDRGTPFSNAMRLLGKAAPTGPVSTGFSAGVPFMIGNAMGGPMAGAGASAASLGIGSLAKRAAAKSVEKDAMLADVLARNGGPLNLPPLVDDETRKALERALYGQGSQYIPR